MPETFDFTKIRLVAEVLHIVKTCITIWSAEKVKLLVVNAVPLQTKLEKVLAPVIVLISLFILISLYLSPFPLNIPFAPVIFIIEEPSVKVKFEPEYVNPSQFITLEDKFNSLAVSPVVLNNPEIVNVCPFVFNAPAV